MPGTGKVLRVNHSGTVEEIAAGLPLPTGMTFGPGIIEARKVWAAVTKLTGRLAQLDYDGFCRLARASRLSALDIEGRIQQYGRSDSPKEIYEIEIDDLHVL